MGNRGQGSLRAAFRRYSHEGDVNLTPGPISWASRYRPAREVLGRCFEWAAPARPA